MPRGFIDLEETSKLNPEEVESSQAFIFRRDPQAANASDEPVHLKSMKDFKIEVIPRKRICKET